MSVRLKFCGAAGTVTGSCHLVEHGGGKLLIDCGMFQGPKSVKALNYGPLPFAADSIDAVLVTHAHTDHAGLLPKLVTQGFKGRMIATEPTAELLAAMLPDSGFIQEMEVENLNRRNEARGLAPVAPIYTQEQGAAVAAQIETQPLDSWIALPGGARYRMHDARHILGAASIELEVPGFGKSAPMRLLFSGDLGMGAAAMPADAMLQDGPFDALIVESTYGDRTREALTIDQRRALLAEEVKLALHAGGNLIVPAFAVERTQMLLGDLIALMRAGVIPPRQIFVDSPLAIKATAVFAKYPRPEDGPINGHEVRFVETAEESAKLARVSGGAIILAASGMCDAGRIRHHLANNLWRPDATVLLVGYMEPGTLGAILAEGHERIVRIRGEPVAVRARIAKLDAYSGHADRQGLLRWIAPRAPAQGAVFLVHGGAAALEAMRQAVIGQGMAADRVIVPKLDEAFVLQADSVPARLISAEPPRRILAAREAVLRGRDWHNDYAALVLSLRQALDQAPDDRSRNRLLERVRSALAPPT